MSEPFLSCLDDSRRDVVRAHELYGLDYVEVEDDGLTLQAYFLGRAPGHIRRENLRIVGGDRIRDLRVEDVRVRRGSYPDRDDVMEIKVDRTGDLSTYTLEVVEAEHDRPTGRPHEGFDPRYSSAEFRFRLDCPSDLDCVQEEICPSEEPSEPSIDYLAKDYGSFRQLMLDRLALIMPEWRERHVPDLGIALVEVLAYVGDHLSYYQDAVATEAYLETARQRVSVRRHARLVDYSMHEGCNARAWVVLQTYQDAWIKPRHVAFVTRIAGIPEGQVVTWDDLDRFASARFQVFEPMDRRRERLRLYRAHNTIRFYTWRDGECCLAKGATSATFVDDGLSTRTERAGKEYREPNLKRGDVLILEEVVGPRTGNPADADPGHRQAVRLTCVEAVVDPLTKQPLIRVEWAPEDALAFPLCLSAIVGPECRLVTDISVARGNVMLVDHGRRMRRRLLGAVGESSRSEGCEGPGLPGDLVLEAEPFRPVLDQSPLTFAQPPTWSAPAATSLEQDPRAAQPQVWIFSRSAPAETNGLDGRYDRYEADTCSPHPNEVRWIARADLIDSAADATDFVVEIDNEGLAHIRFGDGDLGRLPEPGAIFCAGLRLGNGVVGNVGREGIAHMVSRDLIEGLHILVRNPLAAVGGQDPEPMSEVKLFAPTAYRRNLRRAVLAEDYARLAEAEPGVQRAAASLRWTGSWYEAFVAVDPMRTEELDERLRREIERTLRRYRRIGQDLEVASASYVPLEVELSVCVEPDVLRGGVEKALLGLFGNRVLPSGRRGLFHPDNLTFGTSVSVSSLVAAAMSVEGVRSARVTKLHRLFVGPNRELDDGLLPIGPPEIARLDNDANHPENGRLRLEMRGGR